MTTAPQRDSSGRPKEPTQLSTRRRGAHGTSLRIQKVEAFQPRPFTALGWTVPDIGATVDDLSKRGVQFERYGGMDQDTRGIWNAPGGAKVAWFKDPDGNILSLTEL